MKLRTLGLLAAFVLVLASCGGVSPEAAGPSEGIQVHGDWTIDIYNEDGSLDHHYEFSNALLPSGAQALSELLAGTSTPLLSGGATNWYVIASKGDPSSDGDSPCGAPGASVECVAFPGLWLPGDGRLILEATFVAEIDGFIGRVGTVFHLCPTSDPSCAGTWIDFTQTDVVDPVTTAKYQVEAGQQVDIDVEFSFTTG